MAHTVLCRRTSPIPYSTEIVGDKPILVSQRFFFFWESNFYKFFLFYCSYTFNFISGSRLHQVGLVWSRSWLLLETVRAGRIAREKHPL